MKRAVFHVAEFQVLNWKSEQPEILRDRIREAGIVGMGGAGYPTHEKIEKCLAYDPRTVLVNGVECEPGVSADETLIINYAEEILEGCAILERCLGTTGSHLAVGSRFVFNTFKELKKANTTLTVVEATPSSGEERALVQSVLGQHIDSDEFPANKGILVLNVATVFAIYEAVCKGYRPQDRIMTVNCIDVWVPLEEPIECIVGRSTQLTAGGCYTGRLADGQQLTQATLNAIESDRPPNPSPCIRCGWCTDVCPLKLPVEAIYASRENEDQWAQFAVDLNTCFECGACVEACPSQIQILDVIRQERSSLTHQNRAREHARIANERFAERNRRLERLANQAAERRASREQSSRKW